MADFVFTIDTKEHSQMLDITSQIQKEISELDARRGMVTVFVPHTTAGITINEGADPDVARDILESLDRQVPWKTDFYKHGEGNSAAHIKACMMGSSVQVFFERGKLELGTWQSIFFCEFDGPRRNRKVWGKVV